MFALPQIAALLHHTPARAMSRPERGWVLYDARCRLCSGGARLFGPALKRRGFKLAPLQRRWVGERLKMSRAQLLAQGWLLEPDGRLLGGVTAAVRIARTIWWAWPLVALSHMPGAIPVLWWAYGHLVRNRYCFGGKCELRAGPHRPRGYHLTRFWEF